MKQTITIGPLTLSRTDWQLATKPQRILGVQARLGPFGAAFSWKQNTEHRTQNTREPQQEATTPMAIEDRQGRSIWPGMHVSHAAGYQGRPRANGKVIALLPDTKEILVRWPGPGSSHHTCTENPKQVLAYSLRKAAHDAGNVLLLTGDTVRIDKPPSKETGKLTGKIAETGLANDRVRVEWSNGCFTTLRAGLLRWMSKYDLERGYHTPAYHSSAWVNPRQPWAPKPDPVAEAEKEARTAAPPAQAAEDDGSYLETEEMDCGA